MKKAFTLIELLIVVAIIAILAAIAVPNFLEAQTRSKVSRCKADLRSLATAIEAYAVDHNHVPVDYDPASGDPLIPGIASADQPSGICHPGFIDSSGNVHPGLTTPVAYIGNCWLKDPFVSQNENLAMIRMDEQVYTYHFLYPQQIQGRNVHSGYWGRNYHDFYGSWRMCSIGPDRMWYNTNVSPTWRFASIPYDPTNGTVSRGNIWRSQKQGEVKDRPVGDVEWPTG